METNRSELLERVTQHYSRWYDIVPQPQEQLPLAAVGEFHEVVNGYVLVKAAKTYTANRHEYVYFYSVSHLDRAACDACLAQTLQLGEPLVAPVKGHMSTNIVMIVFCDTADADALEALKKTRIRKSFQFSFRGWMEVQTAAITIGKNIVTANSAGYHTAKFLKSVIDPKTAGKKRGLLFNPTKK